MEYFFGFMLIIINFLLVTLFFPIIILLEFIDILYPALLASLFLGYLSLKYLLSKTHSKKLSFFFATIVSLSVLWPASIFSAEKLIQKVAREKYSTEAVNININFHSFGYIHFGGGSVHAGHPHAEIIYEGKKMNWSFSKRDFY